MNQEAIQLTENNIDRIAQTLSDYTADDIRSECVYMLKASIVPVLVTTVRDNRRYVEHIVSISMFWSNATADQLNSITYVPVTQL